MPGTPRDIAYLESKFETGDIPTQQDFYDLFASFVHYLKVVQTEGSSTSNIMSQKSVTDALAALRDGVPSAGDTLNKLYNLIISKTAISEFYNDIFELVGDQSNQDDQSLYWVIDASGDDTVNSGWAIYRKIDTTDDFVNDYIKVQEQEGLDIVVQDASTSAKGIVQLATGAEAQAGTDTTKALTPSTIIQAQYNPLPNLGAGASVAMIHVAACSTGNVNLATTNPVIDGVTYEDYSFTFGRVPMILLKDQTDPEQNGIYARNPVSELLERFGGTSVNGGFAGTTSSVRRKQHWGLVVHVTNGTVNKGKIFKNTSFFDYVGSGDFTAINFVELTSLPTASIEEAVLGTEANKAITPLTLTAAYRTAQSTGAIDFSTPRVYGVSGTPLTGNITANYTNARLGFVQKIYHNDSVAPTVPAGWTNIGVNEYQVGELNIIYCEFIGSSEVEYWIVHPDAVGETILLKKIGKLTVAQIETLGTGGGIDIIPAPGAGKAIQFHNAFIKLPFNTTEWGNTHDELRFEVGLSVVSDNFLLLSLNYTSWAHLPLKVNAAMSTYENLPLKLKCATGNPSGGDSELHYTVFYSIVDTEHT